MPATSRDTVDGARPSRRAIPRNDWGVEVVLVVGTEDTVCEPWQSQDATDALQAEGYDTRLAEVEGGNHFTVVFHDLVDGEWLTLPDDPAGMEVVETILDAIEATQ